MNNLLPKLNQLGFAIVPGILSPPQLIQLQAELDPLLKTQPAAGIRNLINKAPSIDVLAKSASIRALVEPVLGKNAQCVRSILFNKNSETNWHVVWHQDLAIAVKERIDIEGFSAWTVKENVPHTQPPVRVLEQMLTVRLHLDSANHTNGALWVSPGTHRLGRIAANEAANTAEHHGKSLCAVQAGDALLFHPLILHSSQKSHSENQRRVIHLEFSAANTLPTSLTWYES